MAQQGCGSLIYFGRCIRSLLTQLNLLLCLFDFIPQYAFCTILVLSFWSTCRFHKIMANKETFIIFQHINTLEKYASQTMARWFVANRQAIRLFSIFARRLSPQQAAVGSSLTTNINQKARDIMRVMEHIPILSRVGNSVYAPTTMTVLSIPSSLTVKQII